MRFVHGGPGFVRPVLVTGDTFEMLEPLRELAPLHNGHSLDVLHESLGAGPGAKLVAVFDTEFFHDLPEAAALYGLPWQLMEKYGIRRYGFHGFAHAAMMQAWESRRGNGFGGRRLVTIQLGSGCSMAAIRGGRPVDTTMGFTPNEGLLMSTRCGDIDSGLVTWLQRRERWTPETTDQVLNTASGWLGVSGESANMGDLLKSDSERARRAIEIFSHRLRKTLGGYHALLGGLDGVVLSGGVAERAVPLCRRLLGGLEHLGICLDEVEESSVRLDAGEFLHLSCRDSSVLCGIVGGNEHQAMLASVADSDVPGALRAGARNH